jgi:hypothetical protein
MKTKIKKNVLVLAVGLLMAVRANALIISGSAPIDSLYLDGCPDGSATVADLTSSVGWWEGPPFGGGEYHILFRGDTNAFTEALTNFAAIKAPVLDLVIHDGPKNDTFLEVDKRTNPAVDSRVDWEFVVWVPNNWNHLYNSTNAALAKLFKDDPNLGNPAPAPLLNIYIGGDVNLEKIRIPVNLHVRDERKQIK